MQLEWMWKLQELDLSIVALSGEMEESPLHQEVRAAAADLAALKEELAQAEEALQERRKKLRSLEMNIQKLTSDREELRRRMYGRAVASPRELEQMEKKLTSLEKDLESREDEALELMETIEKMDLQRNELVRRAGEQEELLAAKEEQLEAALARLRADLEQLQEQRRVVEAKLEPQFLERYRIMSQRHQGRGLAAVEGDICGGCGVFISSKQKDLLYNPRAMVYCENCGRLLVKRAPEE